MPKYRKNRKKLKDDFDRKMEELARLEQEGRPQQRPSSVSNEAPAEETNVQIEANKKETIDSKPSSSARSNESPQSSGTKTRASPSSRYDDVDVRSKKNYDKNGDYEDRPTPDKAYRRSKLASSLYKSPGKGTPSPSSDRWKEKHSIRRVRSRSDDNDDTSSTRGNSVASPFSITKPKTPTKPMSIEKVSSSSQSTTMQPEELVPVNAATAAENHDDSDSDASFDLLAIKRKRENENMMNRKSTKDTPESKPPENTRHTPKNISRRRKRSNSFSEGEDDEKDSEESEMDRPRKDLPRKRCASDDDDSEYSIERKPKRRRESRSLGEKKTVRKSISSRRSDDEESALESEDDDYQTRPSIRQHRNRNPRKSVASKYDSDDQSSAVSVEMEAKNKPPPTSFADDDDDGFMSDCDPSPDPSTLKSEKKAKSKKKTTTSRYRKEKTSSDDDTKPSPKKKRGRERNNETLLDFDDDDSRGYDDYGGSADELHPIFENPKFGPYEPIEPLVLSKDENVPPIQVPASLSRYLAPFQKEGIRFMYDCLARQSGVILGDEMGCGKTVQVIALLCALFQKTGTRKDLIDIRGRTSLVRKQMMEVRKQRDRALRMGEVLDENIDEFRSSLSLSPWNPVMIIVPPTILDTWKNAFKTFSHFSVSFYSTQTKETAINSMVYGSADILVVPKSAFQAEKHLDEFAKVKWKLVIIDEFHNFKNHKAKISEHLRVLKELHQPLVLGMTGTLMQNNHEELWNLVDLVETNYFGTLDEFKMNIERAIKLGRHKCADPRAKARSEAASADLRQRLSKLYIKRSKKDVLKGQLPDKSEEFILCDLSPLQKEVYRHVVELPDFDLVKHGSRPCDCGINQNYFRKLLKLKDKAEQLEFVRRNKATIVKQSKCCKKVPINPRYGEEGEPRIDPDAAVWRTMDVHCTSEAAAEYGCDRCPWCCCLPCLTKLNKLSSHLGLLQARKTTEAIGSPAYVAYMKEREFAKVALAGVVDRLPGRDFDRNDGIMDDHFSLCGKLKILNNLLQKDYHDGSKVLLFAHSTQSLDLIQNWLKSRGSFEYLRMDGSTPLSKRQQLTDEFNNTPHIFLFLLSIKATGLGLNLTSANRVIMFDVSWNPSWEIQAQDRAHRIGQTRDVHVVRLISKGTVEEMIYLRQIYKEHLKQDTLEEDDNGEAPRVFRGIQGDKYRKGELFGTENLFRFKDEGSFLQDIYNMRPGSRNRGDANSSGFDIHDSRKVSEVLLGMSDNEKKKIGEGDDLVAIKSLSVKPVENQPQDSPLDNVPQESNSADEEQPDARNYRDLFRSDRAGAAIEAGEDGFDEEMGGQTQAAFEIYENMKDDLREEGGNSDGDDVGDDHDGNHVNQDEERIRSKNPSVQVKQETPDNVCSIESTHPTNMMTSTIQTIEQPIPDSISSNVVVNANDESSSINRHIQVKSEDVPESNSENTPVIDPAPPVDGNHRSEIVDRQTVQCKTEDVPESIPDQAPAIETSSSMDGNHRSGSLDREVDVAKEIYETTSKRRAQPKKILLLGHSNIYAANTEYTAANFKRPDYSKKRKSKKKKKKCESK